MKARKKTIKLIIHLTSMTAVVSIVTLNISQVAVVGQPDLNPPIQPDNTQPALPRLTPEEPPQINTPESPLNTQPGGPRFTNENPATQPGGPRFVSLRMKMI